MGNTTDIVYVSFLVWCFGSLFASNIDAILLGDSHKLWTVSNVISYHSSLRTSSSCLRDVGSGNLYLSLVSTTNHSGSVMLKCGDCAGQGSCWRSHALQTMTEQFQLCEWGGGEAPRQCTLSHFPQGAATPWRRRKFQPPCSPDFTPWNVGSSRGSRCGSKVTFSASGGNSAELHLPDPLPTMERALKQVRKRRTPCLEASYVRFYLHILFMKSVWIQDTLCSFYSCTLGVGQTVQPPAMFVSRTNSGILYSVTRDEHEG